jgi:type II secretory pathway pseudopilin PulG
MILPIVMVGLLVVALIGAAMAHTVLLQRRWARHWEQEQQAAWLADSALQRAQTRLASEGDYTGETWNVSVDQLQTGFSGVAIIRVEPGDGAKRIVIEVTYPVHPVHRILQRREKNVKPT